MIAMGALLVLLLGCCLVGAPARAQTIVDQGTLPKCDDCSYESPPGTTRAVDIGFDINFFGQTYSQVYVNNNGNLTFGSPLSTYTPFGLVGTSTTIIAPFFADVDTRSAGTVKWESGVFESTEYFLAEWMDVGYFDQHGDLTNQFSVALTNRSSVAQPGDFDITFAYPTVQWETGDASGGENGRGGSSAHVGFSNGSGAPGTSFELEGSGSPGAFVAGGPHSLQSHSNFGTPGFYVFQVRGGRVLGADLTITKVMTAGPGADQLTFTLRVDNLGPATANGVQIIDPMPAEVGYQSASPGCTPQGTPITSVVCDIGELGADSFRTVDIVVVRGSLAEFTNQAVVVHNDPDPDPSNDTARVIVPAANRPPRQPLCAELVKIASGPSALRFKPTSKRAARKSAFLKIVNQNPNTSITVLGVEAVDGAPFSVVRVKPNLPKRVKPRKKKVFTVRLERGANLGTADAARPYFRVALACGGPES